MNNVKNPNFDVEVLLDGYLESRVNAISDVDIMNNAVNKLENNGLFSIDRSGKITQKYIQQ